MLSHIRHADRSVRSFEKGASQLTGAYASCERSTPDYRSVRFLHEKKRQLIGAYGFELLYENVMGRETLEVPI